MKRSDREKQETENIVKIMKGEKELIEFIEFTPDRRKALLLLVKFLIPAVPGMILWLITKPSGFYEKTITCVLAAAAYTLIRRGL